MSARAGKTPTSAGHTHVGHRGTRVRRVHSPFRSPSTASLTVVIFIYYRGMHDLAMLPDTGADEIIIGLQHPNARGLSTNALKPPPDTPIFTADGSAMKPALGSFRAELQVKARKITTWTYVHQGTPVPFTLIKGL